MVGQPGDGSGGAHLETIEARAGSTSGTVRRVLIFGTLLGVILLGAVYLFGSASHDEMAPNASERIAEEQAAAAEREDVDGVVGIDEDADTFAPDSAAPTRTEN
ncbi:hypothetical protein V5740_01030 [Croceibacterium sp. TMG7-5b_MA50]|uniref:hypothetical protein n=1 Tax=Croceibacterium sp. TMG7-5b_MA50 TaxID=3121290 RepID=UPI0032214729